MPEITIPTIIMCDAVHNHAVKGKWTVTAYTHGNVAYGMLHLPQTHVDAITGAPWDTRILHLCGHHYNRLMAGKAVSLSTPILSTPTITPTSKEDTVTTTITRHIDIKESKKILPFLDFDKLTIKANEVYSTNYRNEMYMETRVLMQGSTRLAGPGWIFNGSEYIGYIGHQDTDNLYVMVFDAGTTWLIDPLRNYKLSPVTVIEDVPKEDTTMPVNNDIDTSTIQGEGWVFCRKCTYEMTLIPKSEEDYGAHMYHRTAEQLALCLSKKVTSAPHATPSSQTSFVQKWDYKGVAWEGHWFKKESDAKDYAKNLGKESKISAAKNGNGFWVKHVS